MHERNLLVWNIMFAQICSKWRNIFREGIINFAWKNYLGQLAVGNFWEAISWRVIIEGVIVRWTIIDAPIPRGPIFLGAIFLEGGGNCPGGNYPGGQLSGGQLSGGNFTEWNCPRTQILPLSLRQFKIFLYKWNFSL